MKAVLLSIRPKWCSIISSGRKTVEVRKTIPKINVPFKCYIYCTKNAKNDPHSLLEVHATDGKIRKGNGKIIGEFVCDGIDKFTPTPKGISFKRFGALFDTQLSVGEIRAYLGSRVGYGWHISELVIYDAPKELNCFLNPCLEYEKDYPQCGNCDYYHSMGEHPAECACDGKKPLRRPPQSWCYVEEKTTDGR